MVRCSASGYASSDHSAWQRTSSQAFSSVKLPKRRCSAYCHRRRRLSCTFFSTIPFSQSLATLQKSGSNR